MNIASYFYFHAFNYSITRTIELACEFQLLINSFTIYLIKISDANFDLFLGGMLTIPLCASLAYMFEVNFISLSSEAINLKSINLKTD